jgi:hypothetical protein
MKLDSARTTDQGDLGRMLGRLDKAAIESVIAIVAKHYGDPQAAATFANTPKSDDGNTRPTRSTETKHKRSKRQGERIAL